MATITSAEVNPDPVRIDGEQFYPKVMPNGKTFYYIRQSNIPDMLRKRGLEWWMGDIQRECTDERLKAWANENAQGDGVISAGHLLAELAAIKKISLYGYQNRDSAGSFGTNAHDWLKARLTGAPEPVLLPGVAEAVKPATEWLETYKVEAVAVECVVFDDTSGVAGRIDLAASGDWELNGERTIAIPDWKTGKVWDEKEKELYLEPRLQNHLYRRGWSSMHGNGKRSKGGWLVKLPRDKHELFHAYPIPWDQSVMTLYDTLVVAWKAMRAVKGGFAGGYR